MGRVVGAWLGKGWTAGSSADWGRWGGGEEGMGEGVRSRREGGGVRRLIEVALFGENGVVILSEHCKGRHGIASAAQICYICNQTQRIAQPKAVIPTPTHKSFPSTTISVDITLHIPSSYSIHIPSHPHPIPTPSLTIHFPNYPFLL